MQLLLSASPLLGFSSSTSLYCSPPLGHSLPYKQAASGGQSATLPLGFSSSGFPSSISPFRTPFRNSAEFYTQHVMLERNLMLLRAFSLHALGAHRRSFGQALLQPLDPGGRVEVWAAKSTLGVLRAGPPSGRTGGPLQLFSAFCKITPHDLNSPKFAAQRAQKISRALDPSVSFLPAHPAVFFPHNPQNRSPFHFRLLYLPALPPSFPRRVNLSFPRRRGKGVNLSFVCSSKNPFSRTLLPSCRAIPGHRSSSHFPLLTLRQILLPPSAALLPRTPQPLPFSAAYSLTNPSPAPCCLLAAQSPTTAAPTIFCCLLLLHSILACSG